MPPRRSPTAALWASVGHDGEVARPDRGWRPFWLHQGAEYLLGLILVAQGLQGTTPAVPAVAGGVVVLNAAIVDGPLGAFRTVSRRQHRGIDVAVITVLFVLSAMPMLDIDASSRILLFGVALLLAVLWWTTSFQPRLRSEPTSASDLAGRVGRLTGRAARAARDRR